MKELTKEILHNGQNVRVLIDYLEDVCLELYNHPDYDENFNGFKFYEDVLFAIQLIEDKEE